MNAVTIAEDVNSYASISQEDTTAPACKATPCRVMTHLVKVFSIECENGQKVGMRTRTREMAMEIRGEEGAVTPIKKSWDAYLFNGVQLTCGFSYHSGVQGGIPIFLAHWYHLGLHFKKAKEEK